MKKRTKNGIFITVCTAAAAAMLGIGFGFLIQAKSVLSEDTTLPVRDDFYVYLGYANQSWTEHFFHQEKPGILISGDGIYEFSYTIEDTDEDIEVLLLETDLDFFEVIKWLYIEPQKMTCGDFEYNIHEFSAGYELQEDGRYAYRIFLRNPYVLKHDYLEDKVIPVEQGDTLSIRFAVMGMGKKKGSLATPTPPASAPTPTSTPKPTPTPAQTDSPAPPGLTPSTEPPSDEPPAATPISTPTPEPNTGQKDTTIKGFCMTTDLYTRVRLKWKGDTSLCYRIYRSQRKNTGYRLLAEVTGKTTYLDTHVVSGRQYYYQIRAVEKQKKKTVLRAQSPVLSVRIKTLKSPQIQIKKKAAGTVRYLDVCVKSYQGKKLEIYYKKKKDAPYRKLRLRSDDIRTQKRHFRIRYLSTKGTLYLKMRTRGTMKQKTVYSGYSKEYRVIL